MTFDVVVAADEAGGIGKGGELPWKLPGDTAFFKHITSDTSDPAKRNAVVMGRKTWDTIPPRFRPLDRRLNVVVTRQAGLPVPAGVIVAASLADAVARLAAAPGLERAFVIGGGEIYRSAIQMPECHRVYLTRVEGRHPADAFFPALGERFRLIEQSDRREENGKGYVFQTWEAG